MTVGHNEDHSAGLSRRDQELCCHLGHSAEPCLCVHVGMSCLHRKSREGLLTGHTWEDDVLCALLRGGVHLSAEPGVRGHVCFFPGTGLPGCHPPPSVKHFVQELLNKPKFHTDYVFTRELVAGGPGQSAIFYIEIQMEMICITSLSWVLKRVHSPDFFRPILPWILASTNTENWSNTTV